MELFWERLSTKHDRESFESGTPELDFYLKNQAGQDRRRNLASIFVLTEDTGNIVGYYALSQDAITAEELPDDTSKKLPMTRKIPCTLLGRLAVDTRYRGQGYGRELLYNALNRAATMSLEIASFAVIVDAKNAQAKEFYKRHNFLEFKNQPLRLFIPIILIQKMVKQWKSQ